MADAEDKNGRENDTVLLAYVTVHLDSDESFELLPFEDAQDVKSKVSDLMKDWAKSGFLVRGNEFYPWHRVRRIEATRVEEMSAGDAKLQRGQWEARETARMQQSFWRTKHARDEKEEEKEGNGGESGEKKGDQPHMAA